MFKCNNVIKCQSLLREGTQSVPRASVRAAHDYIAQGGARSARMAFVLRAKPSTKKKKAKKIERLLVPFFAFFFFSLELPERDLNPRPTG